MRNVRLRRADSGCRFEKWIFVPDFAAFRAAIEQWKAADGCNIVILLTADNFFFFLKAKDVES